MITPAEPKLRPILTTKDFAALSPVYHYYTIYYILSYVPLCTSACFALSSSAGGSKPSSVYCCKSKMVNPSVLQILGVSAVLIYVFVLPLGLHKGERISSDAAATTTMLLFFYLLWYLLCCVPSPTCRKKILHWKGRDEICTLWRVGTN